jgi:hypothetical protein
LARRPREVCSQLLNSRQIGLEAQCDAGRCLALRRNMHTYCSLKLS